MPYNGRERFMTSAHSAWAYGSTEHFGRPYVRQHCCSLVYLPCQGEQPVTSSTWATGLQGHTSMQTMLHLIWCAETQNCMVTRFLWHLLLPGMLWSSPR